MFSFKIKRDAKDVSPSDVKIDEENNRAKIL